MGSKKCFETLLHSIGHPSQDTSLLIVTLVSGDPASILALRDL